MASPYQFANRGQLFIVPVGPSIDQAPYPAQSFARPPDYSLWVGGQVQEPGPHLDRARMTPRLYREVRDDLTRYSPVEVTRSAFRRSQHAYVGVIDSRGTPYYFALDSRGVSVREAPGDLAWKAYDRLADDEAAAAVRERRADAAAEMRRVERELSEPALVVTKGALKYGKKTDWKNDVPHSSWWKLKQRKKEPPEGAEGSAPSAEAAEKSNNYAAVLRRVGHELRLQLDDGERELDPPRPEDVDKALPRAAREEKVKKTPSVGATKKQAGAGGRTRYTYPGEKSGSRPGPGKQVPLVVVHDDTRHADPAELADQLGVSVRTLERAARRLGSDGFAGFMRSHLKRFATKHRLDPDYWGTLYANLVAGQDAPVVKSEGDDAAWKQFGGNVNAAASAVPGGHPGRFFDSEKVFVHHVHHEMKQRGTYSGDLDAFKQHLVHAQQQGHVRLSRADLVGAMDPHSVERSEIRARGASFHFVNAEHDPKAIRAPEKAAAPSPAPSGPAAPAKSKPRRRRALDPGSPHHDAAVAASDAAREASARAGRLRTTDSHLAAMTAHHHAGVAHQKATGKTSDKTALRHFEEAMSHHSAAKTAG